MKKKLGFLFVFFSVLLILTACGGKEKNSTDATAKKADANGRVTLDFWSFWGSGARKDVIEAIIADFNQSQDKITVKYTYQPWGDIWTKSLSAITAGNPPDVIVQDINSVAQRAQAKQATALDKYIDKDTSKQFYPQLWETTLCEDKSYALPFNTDTQVIFYNKKLLKEVGVTEDNLPQTWDELEKVAHKLDQKKRQ